MINDDYGFLYWNYLLRKQIIYMMHHWFNESQR